MIHPGPAADVDAEAIREERELADAHGVIREVHDYCASRCPLRDHCPGMACKQYQREMAAKDVIASYEDAPTYAPPVGPAGIILEPTVR